METKPSVYTSEFWLHLIGQLLLWANTSNVWNYFPGTWGHIGTVIASALLGLGYFNARGRAKQGKQFNPLAPGAMTLIPRKKHLTSATTVRAAPPARRPRAKPARKPAARKPAPRTVVSTPTTQPQQTEQA